MPRSRLRLFWPVVMALTGCKWFFPAPVPMRTIWRASEPSRPSQAVFVLLPGRGDDAEVFDANGFLTSLTRPDVGVDAVAVNATMGYYLRRSVVDRVYEDVLSPARTRGHSKIWIGGVSMGAMGSLLTVLRYPREIEGVLLMGAYLGDKEVIDEIVAQGGLSTWKPPAVYDEADYQRNVWRWLKEQTAPGSAPAKIYLGFGTEDRLLRSNEVLAAALPRDHVFRVAGGHTWEAWSEVFRQFLASGALGSHPDGSPADPKSPNASPPSGTPLLNGTPSPADPKSPNGTPSSNTTPSSNDKSPPNGAPPSE